MTKRSTCVALSEVCDPTMVSCPEKKLICNILIYSDSAEKRCIYYGYQFWLDLYTGCTTEVTTLVTTPIKSIKSTLVNDKHDPTSITNRSKQLAEIKFKF